jgi:hypothetical protein
MKTKLTVAALVAILVAATASCFAQSPSPASGGKKPNILVIWGDDIGTTDVSAYSDGLMGFETPNIDRIAKEGIRFLQYYGEQSCTAGRAAFLTGQHGIRTGLTKVGFPGAPMGMSQLDPSIGGLLKSLGYATGQFGKNHVGDRNETLPTVNGFDEFFGNLYHLNAEEEPELPDYPKDPAFRAKWGPRGVLKCKATDKDDATVDPRFGKVGSRGLNPDKDAIYLNITPKRNDGTTIYKLHVKDVPVDGFWSISLYGPDGFFHKNKFDAYTLNNVTAKKDAGGSVTIQFGACDGKIDNCLPIMKGWNYMVRLYRPRKEILDGTWKFPEAQPLP